MQRFNLSIDAITTIMQKEGHQPGRKLLLWVGPGWPLLDGSNQMLTARLKAQFFGQILYFSQMLRKEQITLYSVSLGQPNLSTSLYHGFLKGVKTDKQAAPSDLNTKVIAVQSGGLVLGPDNDLSQQLDSCVLDASAYYTLSLDPPRPDTRDEYRDLQVVVDKPEVRVRTSTGYYDEP